MEVELAWGQHDLPNADHSILSDGRQAETETLERLLSLCDQYQIPISFDVVGHLLKTSCDGIHNGPHEAGWFAADPGTDVDSDPLFYAPDLVRMIHDADVNHEICTHSYSHVLGDDINPAVLAWELRTVNDLWKSRGLPSPVSYVPPRHESSHIDVLRSNGIKTVRQTIDDISLSGGPLQSYVERYRCSIPDVQPKKRDSVIETYSTPFPSLSSPALPNGQRPAPKSLQVLPVQMRQWMHRRWLITQTKSAAKRDSYLHLWTHLFNISNEQQRRPLFQYLRQLAALRNDSEVTIVPMRELADDTRRTNNE